MNVKDEIREERIHMEAIVDAYDPEERALGWYYYLENKILAVPLSQLQPLNPYTDTSEAISDWHYWKNQGYMF